MTTRRTYLLLGVVTLLACGMALRAAWPVIHFAPAARLPALVSLPPGLSHAAGVLHVHSRRSDGSGTFQGICEAARAEGLDFVVVTDHGSPRGDEPPPETQGRTLCASGAELSVDGGHYLAIGMKPAPYRLGGDPAEVAEDVRRLGGVGFAAHPDSVKDELRWHDWRAAIDGLELLNGDTVWRRAPSGRLAVAALLYLFNPRFALARLLEPDAALFDRWDDLTRTRPLVGIAGADAHARLGRSNWRTPEGSPAGPALHVPSYAAAFALFRTHVLVGRPGPDAASRYRALVDALRAGHAYIGIDALADAAGFGLEAEAGGRAATMGDVVHPASGVAFRAAVAAPPGTRLQLLRDGVVVRDEDARRPLNYTSSAEGTYRVEAWLDPTAVRAGAQFPWIVSNPIYVHRDPAWGTVDARPPARREVLVEDFEDHVKADWHEESGGGSVVHGPVPEERTGEPGHAGRVEYRLAAGGAGDHTWAALADRTPRDLRRYDRLAFDARADHPMRLSVQVRTAGGADGVRWRRSVYIDTTWTTRVIFFEDLRPVGAAGQAPDLAHVQSLLFVVDLEHAFPETAGRYWLDNIRVGEAARSQVRTVSSR